MLFSPRQFRKLYGGFPNELPDIRSHFYRVYIKSDKTKKFRRFWFDIIPNSERSLCPVCVLDVYYASVSGQGRIGEFFRTYRKNVGFIRSNLGINWFYGSPKVVAKRIGLSEEEIKNVKGHSHRRTGAKFLFEAGKSLAEVKRAGRWKNNATPEEYWSESDEFKFSLAQSLQGEENFGERRGRTDLGGKGEIVQPSGRYGNLFNQQENEKPIPTIPSTSDIRYGSFYVPPIPSVYRNYGYGASFLQNQSLHYNQGFNNGRITQPFFPQYQEEEVFENIEVMKRKRRSKEKREIRIEGREANIVGVKRKLDFENDDVEKPKKKKRKLIIIDDWSDEDEENEKKQ